MNFHLLIFSFLAIPIISEISPPMSHRIAQFSFLFRILSSLYALILRFFGVFPLKFKNNFDYYYELKIIFFSAKININLTLLFSGLPPVIRL